MQESGHTTEKRKTITEDPGYQTAVSLRTEKSRSGRRCARGCGQTKHAGVDRKKNTSTSELSSSKQDTKWQDGVQQKRLYVDEQSKFVDVGQKGPDAEQNQQQKQEVPRRYDSSGRCTFERSRAPLRAVAARTQCRRSQQDLPYSLRARRHA